MNRRTAIRRLSTLFLTTASLAHAQQTKKVTLLGYLSNSDPVRESARAEVIRLALRELGHVEGQNFAIEYRYAEGKRDRYPELVAELVRLNIDIIVAAGGSATVRAAQNATKTIPIVMVGAGLDPVEAGVVESLARPGGNVTGITLLNSELGGKRLELLKEAVPKLARVAVLYDPASPNGVREVKELLPVAARALRLTIQPWEVRVRSADAFEKVFAALSKERPDGLYVVTGTAITAVNRKQIVGLALKSQLPSVVTDKAYVELGGFISYGRIHRQLPARRLLRG